MIKIGILYICTGSYIEFFDDFYLSSEKYFFLDCEKHYFVFTDGDNQLFHKNERIHVIPQHQLEWPHAVLYKFHYFLQVQHLFVEMDYLIMTNSNMRFLDKINKNEILPVEKHNYLFGTEGPWLYKTGKLVLEDNLFENNIHSKAYINNSKRNTYYAAGFCGGRKKNF